MARQGATPSPAHLLVDVGVNDAVEDVCARRSKQTTKHRRDSQLELGQPVGRQEHHWQGRHQKQLNNARLGQGNVSTHDVAGRQSGTFLRLLHLRLDRVGTLRGWRRRHVRRLVAHGVLRNRKMC